MNFKEAMAYMTEKPEEHICMNKASAYSFMYRMNSRYRLEYRLRGDEKWKASGNLLHHFGPHWTIFDPEDVWEEIPSTMVVDCLRKGDIIRSKHLPTTFWKMEEAYRRLLVTKKRYEGWPENRWCVATLGIQTILNFKWERKVENKA